MKENWQVFIFSIGLTMTLVTPIIGVGLLQYYPEYLTAIIILMIPFIGLGIAICNFTFKTKSDEEKQEENNNEVKEK